MKTFIATGSIFRNGSLIQKGETFEAPDDFRCKAAVLFKGQDFSDHVEPPAPTTFSQLSNQPKPVSQIEHLSRRNKPGRKPKEEPMPQNQEVI